MVGVVGVLLFFVLSVSNAQSTEATRFVLDRMSKNGVGLQESEFEVLWVQILGDENHTLVSTNGTNYTLCNTSTNVFLEEDTDGSNQLEFAELSSAMARLWTMTMLCEEEHEEEVHSEACQGGAAEIWGYSILANLIISLFSMIGVLSVPFGKSQYFKFILNFLLALSAGTMFGDALIHIIPAMLGLHAHGEEESAVLAGETEPHGDHEEISHEGESELDILYEIGPLVLTALWILVFFLLEKAIIRIVGHQHHNHAIEELEIDGLEKPERSVTEDLPVDPISEGDKESSEKKMIHPAGYLLLIGDGTHNFVDGLAIGLAFSSSFDLGFATSIAVMVHEVPQEFGDFALLISSGFTRKEALMFNLLSACVSLIGSFVGCGIGSIGNADRWILPVVAGSFFYISLCDIVPILHQEARKHSWKIIFLQTSGIVLGIGIMMILAMYEVIPVSLCGEGENHDDH